MAVVPASASQVGAQPPAVTAYVVNQLKEMARRLMPAHRRFIRAGESFLTGGEREVHELPTLVTPGSTVVDVGAHIGDYTYNLCRLVGPSGRVIAVEPLPDLAKMLSRAARRLGLPVTVLNCALSSKSGEANLHVPVENGERMAGYASLVERDAAWGARHRVSLRPLDDVCKDVAGPCRSSRSTWRGMRWRCCAERSRRCADTGPTC
jgi:FkbM family methyltransferase